MRILALALSMCLLAPGYTVDVGVAMIDADLVNSKNGVAPKDGVILAILSVALAVGVLAGVAAQVKPNVAGTWQADPAAGQGRGGGGGPETITIEGNRMTISRTAGGSRAFLVYLLDGTPSKNADVGGGTEATCTSTWEGDVLVTTIAMPHFTRTEKRWIEADGTMKVEHSFTGGPDNKPIRTTQVFRKAAM